VVRRVHIFPPDVDPGAPPAPGARALAGGPRPAFRLRDLGWEPVDLLGSFGDRAQAAALDEALSAADAVEAALAGAGLEPALVRILQAEAARLVCAWRRFEAALGEADELIVHETTGAVSRDRGAAFLRFLQADPGPGDGARLAAAVLERVDRVNRLAARCLLPGLPYVVDQRSESGRFRLDARVGRLRIAYLRPGEGPRRGRLRLVSGIQGWSQRRLLVPLDGDGAVGRRLAASGALARWPAGLAGLLGASAGRYLASRRHAAVFLERARGRRITGLYNELITPGVAGIASALHGAGHDVILISHGSLCVHGEPRARRIAELLARAGLNWSASATHFVPRAPIIAGTFPAPSRGHVLPARFTRLPAVPPRPPSPFVILHAGNYVRWGNVAYIAPTESEYLEALVHMADAVEANPHLRLDVRIKAGVVQTGEAEQAIQRTATRVGGDVFARARGWSSRVVRSAERTFAEALARADLVVSEGLTATMHEALEAGKPVLLHTVTDRFAHMPARAEPPTPGDRAAVYRCGSGPRLGAMLEAIRVAHQDAPLTEAELVPHRWPPGSPPVEAALAAVVTGRHALCAVDGDLTEERV
jgi:hypothetical protein